MSAKTLGSKMKTIWSDRRMFYIPSGYVLDGIHYHWDEETNCYVSPFGVWMSGIPQNAKIDIRLQIGACTICDEWLKKDGSVETKAFKATINWIDDRGDYWYVGYRPVEYGICEFGTFKVHKDRLCKFRNMFVAEY